MPRSPRLLAVARAPAERLPPLQVERFSMMVSATGRWYVVQTLPHKEAGAEFQLKAQKFATFLPRVDRTIRHARQLRNVRAPLFPGYVFVQLDLARDRWRSVMGTYGVARLVMANELPAPVPHGVIEALREAVDASGIVRLDGNLRVGQRIQVMAGPFAGAIGTLDRLDPAGRVRVLLDIMGANVPVIAQRRSLRVA